MPQGINDDSKAPGFSPFDTGEALRARLRLLDTERARVVSALRAYEAGSSNGTELQGLDLNDCTVKEAAVKLLIWHAVRGTSEVEAGDIEAAMKNFRLRMSRGGRLASEAKSLWLILRRVLTSPANVKMFKVVSTGSSSHRKDRVSYIGPAQKSKKNLL